MQRHHRQVGPDGHLRDEPLHAPATTEASPEWTEKRADGKGTDEYGQLKRTGSDADDSDDRRGDDRQRHEDAVEGGEHRLHEEIVPGERIEPAHRIAWATTVVFEIGIDFRSGHRRFLVS